MSYGVSVALATGAGRQPAAFCTAKTFCPSRRSLTASTTDGCGADLRGSGLCSVRAARAGSGDDTDCEAGRAAAGLGVGHHVDVIAVLQDSCSWSFVPGGDSARNGPCGERMPCWACDAKRRSVTCSPANRLRRQENATWSGLGQCPGTTVRAVTGRDHQVTLDHLGPDVP
jgi:hypothetical protein